MKSSLRAALAAFSLGVMTLTAVPALAQPGHGKPPPGHGRHDARHDGRHEWRGNERDWRGRDTRRDVRNFRGYDWNRPDPQYNAYFANRYYRSGGNYRPIPVTRNTRIYRGYDDRYYCRRSDGTTGLIVGAALGGLLGNQIDVGGSDLLRTVLGGAAGGLLGREIDRGGVSCR